MTINPKNDDDKWFQYAATITLCHEDTEVHLERDSNIKLFIKNYNWKGLRCPLKTEEWKRLQINNPTIALNVLHIKEKQICLVYTTNINSSCEEQ